MRVAASTFAGFRAPADLLISSLGKPLIEVPA
jgi:hypothetical protein